MPYNQKKETTETPYSKKLENYPNDYNIRQDGLTPYDNLLSKERKGNKNYSDSGKLPFESQLENVRSKSANEITEKQLEKSEGGYNLKRTVGDPIMDYYKKTENESIDIYNKEKTKTKERTMDEMAGIQKIEKETKIIKNEQNSQLLSNYKNRETFIKNNPSINKKSMNKLFDADAMIFHLFKQAASQNRSLNKKEELIIKDIENVKKHILAQSYNIEGYHEDFQDEERPIEVDVDRIEEEEKILEQFNGIDDDDDGDDGLNDSLEEELDEGKKAYNNGYDLEDNPYDEVSQNKKHIDWQEGWLSQLAKSFK